MSDDILVLAEGKGNANDLEVRKVPKEQVLLADMRGARKISRDARHAGKILLERRMEEFERFIFRT